MPRAILENFVPLEIEQATIEKIKIKTPAAKAELSARAIRLIIRSQPALAIAMMPHTFFLRGREEAETLLLLTSYEDMLVFIVPSLITMPFQAEESGDEASIK